MTSPSADATDLVRRRVINVVGHELRTPVTTVRGLAELLVGTSDEEAREVIVPALIRNARRCEELLDDLLILSEIHTAHPVDDSEPVDMGEIADIVAEHTIVRVEGRPAGRAVAHRELVRRSLQHLVSNAVQFHEAVPSIRFESDADTIAAVVVTPVDRPVTDVDLTFEVFFRGENAVTRAAGLGIGLPAARALARVDGGDVEVESTGGEFIARLRLPRAPEAS